MWTGRHPHAIGCWNNYTGLTHDAVTFGTVLAEAGYRVGDLGRRDKTFGSHSLRCRCTTWGRRAQLGLPENGPHDHAVVDERYANPWDWNNLRGDEPFRADRNLLDWLEDAAGDDRPFVCHFGIGAVHTGRGYVTARRFLDAVPADAVRLPPAETPSHPAIANQAIAKNCPPRDEQFVHTCRRHYAANIAEVDELVGEVLDRCEALGLLDNTYVLFISDHGDMQMEHGCLWGKGNLYDAACRVPLIVRPPGGAEPRAIDRPVSLLDLLPTFCDLAGVETPPDADGHSLAADLHGETPDHPGEAVIQYHNAYLPGSAIALRRGDHKYAAYEVDGQWRPQLFNVADDPDEINDLIDARPELAGELDAALRAHFDIDAVIAANAAWDRRMFRTWRASQGRNDYLRRLREEIYGCWGQPFTDDHLARLEAWMDR
jgi:arylsulfatase A-like enzyme